MISHSVPARVGLLGNPSDGYGGRTLAMAITGMAATVTVAESDDVLIRAPQTERAGFGSIGEFVGFVDRFGYGTGEQLMAAGLRSFVDMAHAQRWSLPRGVEITYDTTIPRGVGLAGSSALVIALLRGLLELCGTELSDRLLPALALSVEADQLGIAAGLQDRVVQSYGGLISMDFGSIRVDARTGLSYGRYEPVEPDALPPLFLAYSPTAAEPSAAYHRALRTRFEAGTTETVVGLRELAGLVPRGLASLRWGGEGFGALLGTNMDIRASLAPVPERQLKLVDAATACGLDATFTGSGGAIVGVFNDAEDLNRLRRRLGGGDQADAPVVRPVEVFRYER